MDKELASKLTEVVGNIQTSVGKASDFVISQLPDVAQQYIMWGRASETFYFLSCAILSVFCIVDLFKNIRAAQSAEYKTEAEFIVKSLVEGVASIALVIGTFANASAFLMVWFAPKIYLLKGIGSLVK